MIRSVYWLLRIFSIVIDLAILLFLFTIMAFGLYGIWDVNEIYDAAESKHFISYKPDKRKVRPEYSFEELKKKNSEAVGWLEIYDTSIDYPIMQAKDNIRYLTTDPFGSYSATGSIFLDARNSSGFSDSSTIIYGHHMAHHAMFSDLSYFAEKDFFAKHLYGELYADGKRYGLRILAYLKTRADDYNLYRLSFSKEDDWHFFLSHLKELAINSRFSLLSELEEKEAKIVILSTCSERVEGRQIVVAQRTEEIFDNPFLNKENNTLTTLDRNDRINIFNAFFKVLIGAFVIFLSLYLYSGYQLKK